MQEINLHTPYIDAFNPLALHFPDGSNGVSLRRVSKAFSLGIDCPGPGNKLVFFFVIVPRLYFCNRRQKVAWNALKVLVARRMKGAYFFGVKGPKIPSVLKKEQKEKGNIKGKLIASHKSQLCKKNANSASLSRVL